MENVGDSGYSLQELLFVVENVVDCGCSSSLGWRMLVNAVIVVTICGGECL